MSLAEKKRIYILSDGTGETAVQMVKAALVQFEKQKIAFYRFKNVRSKNQIAPILEEAEKEKAIVFYTLVQTELRSHVVQVARDKSVPVVDLLGPILAGLGSFFGYAPRAVAGLLHDVNENYFRRIEAMEYTVQHDDGKDMTNLHSADLILLGISRTSKTPLSIYLSHQGWKVVNVPIIPGFELPREILEVDPRKIVCLTIDPEDLTTIRRNRLHRLGHGRGGEYADPDKVNAEIDYANHLYKTNRKWPVFNVTGRAVEEVAAEIIKIMASRQMVPEDPWESP